MRTWGGLVVRGDTTERNLHGTVVHAYAPSLTDVTPENVRRYFTPSVDLGERSVSVPPTAAGNNPVKVAEYNPSRKLVSMENRGSTNVYVGTSPSVSAGAAGQANSGWTIAPGGALTFDNGDYIGPLYAIGDVGASAVDLRVIEPFA